MKTMHIDTIARESHIVSRIRNALIVCIFCTFLAATEAEAQEAATSIDDSHSAAVSVVKELHEKLMYIMQQADSLGYQGRYDYIKDVVTARFDTYLIAKVIMSRYWRQLEDPQKMDFIKLFQKLSVATYASRFDGYGGEKFVELSAEQLKKGRLLIKTELQRPDDTPVRLDYLMHQKEGDWLIISVIANGVNDLSLKRAEYATVIEDKGFDGLVGDVSAKIANMENKAATP